MITRQRMRAFWGVCMLAAVAWRVLHMPAAVCNESVLPELVVSRWVVVAVFALLALTQFLPERRS